MSTATAILRRSNDEHPAKRRRAQIVKIAIASLFVLLLMYAGFQGRQHARLQARLDEMMMIRDQLQQALDEAQTPAEQLVARIRGANANGSPPPSSPQVAVLINALRTRVGQFDAEYSPRQLSDGERFEIGLNRATLANAEQRFAEALTLLEDEKGKRANTGTENGLSIRALQVRGDSFYGLQEWRKALDRYEQVLSLKPDRMAAIARAADCQYALGRTNDALTRYDELAKLHNDRGNGSLVQGKPDAAVAHYLKAIEVQSWLIAQEGRSALANDLAMSHRNVANAFLAQGKPDAAIGHYERTIEIQVRLIEQQGRAELANDLAISHSNLGTALLSQRKLDAVLAHYEKAIEIQTRLTQQPERSDLANELAMVQNNRGAVRRVQGKMDLAIADFDAAIKTLTALIEQPGRNEPFTAQTNRSTVRPGQVKVDIIIEYSEKEIELQTRPRLADHAERRALALTLAMILKNRGHAYLIQRKAENAIGDFTRAADIYARLVEQGGQTDLALPLAMSLSSLAWIYATNPDPSFRDGRKAKAYALKACELSEWKAFGPLQSLAAACAETGDFAGAVKWQATALERAPRDDKIEVRSRLELYQSGKPYRTPLPKAG